ncbi:MAG: DJ-1/PfpI family protein, partial [Muribaculaceae bacterium]
MKDSFVFLAQGFEEIEAITVVDVLRRANIQVKTVSITNSLQVEGVHGITVTANSLFSDIDFKDLDWIILPGGMPGASNLAAFAP